MSGAILEFVSIVCDGYRIAGFQDVEIGRSMQDAAMYFTMEASAASWSPQAMALRYGEEIQIFSSPDLSGNSLGDLVLTGAVDGYDSEIGPQGRRVSLNGRSAGRDAIDCHPVDHPTGLVKNKTLLQAAQEFDEFGVGWETDQQLQPIDKIQRRPEEPMFDTIERHARREGLMLVAQPSGKILITRAGTKRHAGALVLGQSPVNSMGVQIGNTHRRNPIVVRGQSRGGHGKANLRQEYRDDRGSSGGRKRRHRPGLVIAEGHHTKAQLKRRAQWERLRQEGAGIKIRTRVSRWRDDNGILWMPGLLMPITNDIEDVDGDFTLSAVKLFQRDGNGEGAGTRAEMEFVDPRSFGGQAGAGKSDEIFSPGEALQ